MREIDLCLHKYYSYRIKLKMANLVNKLSTKLNFNIQLCIYKFLTLKYVEIKLQNNTKCDK